MTNHDLFRMLLDERSAALARRPEADTSTTETDSYLVCACGAERLALRLSQVGSILAGRPCTLLPTAPAGLLGVVVLSGRIVTVVDLGSALGLPSSGASVETGHLVRLRQHKPEVALAVERVLGIVDVDPAILRKSGSEAGVSTCLGEDGVSGYAPPGCAKGLEFNESFAVVDLPRVLMRFGS